MRFGRHVQVSSLIVACIGLLPVSLYGQSTGAKPFPAGLGEPHHREMFDEALRSGHLKPTWDNGYLIVLGLASMANSNAETPSVSLYDSRGVRVRRGTIWFEGATEVQVRFATASASGEIIANGHARTVEGLATFYIARTDLSGNVTDVIRTGSFASTSVCAASDGTVWGFGRDLDLDEQGKDYGMLRQYDFRKGLIREELPRISFPTRSVSMLIQPYGAGKAILRCSGRGVSLHINRSGEFGEYFELPTSTGILLRWRVEEPPIPSAEVSGFAVTESGDIFGNVYEYRGYDEGPGSSLDGFYRLELDESKGTASWFLLPGTLTEGSRNTHGNLYGADGPSLVLNSRHYGRGTVWVTPRHE